MDLSFTIQDYLPLISETEVYFLQKVLPYILLFPWFVMILFWIVRRILEYLSTLKPKPNIHSEIISPVQASIEEEKFLRLKEIERLALTDPRAALYALSVYIRKVEFKKFHSVYSLEYFVENNRTHKNAKIYSEIVLHSYSKIKPESELVLNFIREIRRKG